MKNRSLFSVILFLILSLGVFSCSDRPSCVLREKDMVKLMADMEIAEAYVNTQSNFNNDDREMIGRRVLEAHGVSEETLDTTLAWYGRNMDDYSQLFEKVDKEIAKRQKKYTETGDKRQNSTDNLWVYGDHLMLASLSGDQAFTFNIFHPDLESGEIVRLSFYMPNAADLKGSLGVEYSDGEGEATVSNFSKNKVQIELQTDTTKTISRIYGTMLLKDKNRLPLYIDSISLTGLPIDTLNYRSKRRNQKSFGSFRD